MTEALKYYLGNLLTKSDIPEETKALRNIITTQFDNPEILTLILDFFKSQNKAIESDSVTLIIRAVMPSYGAEYLGLSGADWSKKVEFFRNLIQLFPEEYSFKFYFAESACLLGLNLSDYYHVLEDGMRRDTENTNYPSAELFEVIADSQFNFQFDIFLFEKYYQPCSREQFDDYLSDFKNQYQTKDQREMLDKIIWKES